MFRTRVQSGDLLSEFRPKFYILFLHLNRNRWEGKIYKLWGCAQSNPLRRTRCDVDCANFLRKSTLLCCLPLKGLEFIMLDCSIVINSFFGSSLYLKEKSVAIPKTDDPNVRRFPCKMPNYFCPNLTDLELNRQILVKSSI